MLTQVTITGADDAVDPRALVDLSAEFPFVEWGILLSPSQSGRPRYPTLEWLSRLAEHADSVRLSAHLCGAYTRAAKEGPMAFGALVMPFWPSRMQVNGWNGHVDYAFLELLRAREGTWILQCRDESELALAREVSADFGPRVSALFDGSGGRGIAPSTWPQTPPDFSVGFAGGITPDTVTDVLAAIGPREGSYWIDIESGVRSPRDELDFWKVRTLLSRVRDVQRPL